MGHVAVAADQHAVVISWLEQGESAVSLHSRWSLGLVERGNIQCLKGLVFLEDE